MLFSDGKKLVHVRPHRVKGKRPGVSRSRIHYVMTTDFRGGPTHMFVDNRGQIQWHKGSCTPSGV